MTTTSPRRSLGSSRSILSGSVPRLILSPPSLSSIALPYSLHLSFTLLLSLPLHHLTVLAPHLGQGPSDLPQGGVPHRLQQLAEHVPLRKRHLAQPGQMNRGILPVPLLELAHPPQLPLEIVRT